MKKNSKLHISISSQDKLRLTARAENVGMSLSSYILFIVMNAKPKIEIEEP